MSEKLQTLNLQVIYGNPLKRALHTAQIIAESNNLPLLLNEGMQECDYGDLEGLSFAEVFKLSPEVIDAFTKSRTLPLNLGFPNGENVAQVLNRGLTSLHEIMQGQHSVVGQVTSAGMMSVLLCHWEWKLSKLPNCCVAKIVYDGEFHFEGFLS